MKSYFIIFLFTLLNISLYGQGVIELDFKDISCSQVDVLDSRDLEFPLWNGFVDLDVEWIYAHDSTITRYLTHGSDYLIDQLLFFDALPAMAFDIDERRFYKIGEGKFQNTFRDNSFALFKNKQGRKTYTSFIRLNDSDTTFNLYHTSSIGSKSRIFSDSIFWVSNPREFYAFNLYTEERYWGKTIKPNHFNRFESYKFIKGNSLGAVFKYEYYNYITDSTYVTNYYINSKNWKVEEIKINNPEIQFTDLNGHSLYFSGTNKSLISVDIPARKVNWCISGDWNEYYIEKNNKRISINYTMDVKKGEFSSSGNKYNFDSWFSEWGNYYVTTASEGHQGAQHLYLINKNFDKFFSPSFKYEYGELPGDMKKFIEEDGKIIFINTEDNDRTLAYFNYDDKTYIMSLRINHDSFKSYEDVYGERR